MTGGNALRGARPHSASSPSVPSSASDAPRSRCSRRSSHARDLRAAICASNRCATVPTAAATASRPVEHGASRRGARCGTATRQRSGQAAATRMSSGTRSSESSATRLAVASPAPAARRRHAAASASHKRSAACRAQAASTRAPSWRGLGNGGQVQASLGARARRRTAVGRARRFPRRRRACRATCRPDRSACAPTFARIGASTSDRRTVVLADLPAQHRLPEPPVSRSSAGQDHGIELQALRAMQRHHLHGRRVGFARVAANSRFASASTRSSSGRSPPRSCSASSANTRSAPARSSARGDARGPAQREPRRAHARRRTAGDRERQSAGASAVHSRSSRRRPSARERVPHGGVGDRVGQRAIGRSIRDNEQIGQRKAAPGRAQDRKPRESIGGLRERARKRQQIACRQPVEQAFEIDGRKVDAGRAERRQQRLRVAACADQHRDTRHACFERLTDPARRPWPLLRRAFARHRASA